MHIIIFAFLKLDRLMENSLPVTKYPPISGDQVYTIIFLSWVFSASFSVLVHNLYSCSYEPAVLLCIPSLPASFFITGLTLFCCAFFILFCGFFSMILNIEKVCLGQLISTQLNFNLELRSAGYSRAELIF